MCEPCSHSAGPLSKTPMTPLARPWGIVAVADWLIQHELLSDNEVEELQHPLRHLLHCRHCRAVGIERRWILNLRAWPTHGVYSFMRRPSHSWRDVQPWKVLMYILYYVWNFWHEASFSISLSAFWGFFHLSQEDFILWDERKTSYVHSELGDFDTEAV